MYYLSTQCNVKSLCMEKKTLKTNQNNMKIAIEIKKSNQTLLLKTIKCSLYSILGKITTENVFVYKAVETKKKCKTN